MSIIYLWYVNQGCCFFAIAIEICAISRHEGRSWCGVEGPGTADYDLSDGGGSHSSFRGPFVPNDAPDKEVRDRRGCNIIPPPASAMRQYKLTPITSKTPSRNGLPQLNALADLGVALIKDRTHLETLQPNHNLKVS